MLLLFSQLIPVVGRTLILYVFLVVAIRLLGRRQTAELSTLELAVIMVLGSSVETALVVGDRSLLAGLTSAATLFLSDRALANMRQRWPRLRKIMMGRPIPVVYNGQFLPQRMRQAGLSEDDVLHGIRQLGFYDVKQVKLAMLEIHGRISALAMSSEQDRGKNALDRSTAAHD